MTPAAVIQVEPGIGDTIWHLSFIRAIAAASPGTTVTFLAPPSSHAMELLQGEECVAQTIHFEHHGSELQRGINLLRLVILLRRCRFRTLWILSERVRPALAGVLAGIPERVGLGIGAQRFYITNRGIDGSRPYDRPLGALQELLRTMNVPLATPEPDLRLPQGLIGAIANRYASLPRPWIVLALGASKATRDWPESHWLAFVPMLRLRTLGTVFVIGLRDKTSFAAKLVEQSGDAVAVNACGLGIIDVAALIRNSDCFVGPDSGPMNIAAAVGTPAFGLFGNSPALSYSKYIHPILPRLPSDSRDGMAGISPAHVLSCIEPYLTLNDRGGSRKPQA